LFIEIIHYCEVDDLPKITMVSKLWKRAVYDDRVWKQAAENPGLNGVEVEKDCKKTEEFYKSG